MRIKLLLGGVVLLTILLLGLWFGRYFLVITLQRSLAHSAFNSQDDSTLTWWQRSVQNPIYKAYLVDKGVPDQIMANLYGAEPSTFSQGVEDLAHLIVHEGKDIEFAAAYNAETEHVLDTAAPEVRRDEPLLLDRFGYRSVVKQTELVQVKNFRVWFDGQVRAREVIGGSIGDGATVLQLETVNGNQARGDMEKAVQAVVAKYNPAFRLYKFYAAQPSVVDIVEADDYVPMGAADILIPKCNMYVPVGVQFLPAINSYQLTALEVLDSFACPADTKYAKPVAAATCTDCTYYPADKWHALSKTYAPATSVMSAIKSAARLAPALVEDINAMFADMQAQGVQPRIASAYRSYTQQADAYQYWVNFLRQQDPKLTLEKAKLEANRFSALPGFSEHQLGTVIDIAGEDCSNFSLNCVQNVKVWNWMAENAYKYGFLISYPKGKEAVTGYVHEPWHYRWVGKQLAAEFPKDAGKTLNVWLRERYYTNLAETLSRQ